MRKSILTVLIGLVIFSGCEKEGDDEKISLIDFIIEPAGDNCSSGGYKIISGIDSNGDEILDENEIQNTNYICNGDDGDAGANSLLSVIPEPAGANCSTGGYRIISGIDLNGNDILDEIEIQNTNYICNGDSGDGGANSLLNVLPEPVGENCSTGGYKVISGVDSNNNSILDESEIQNTEYICNGDDKTVRINFPGTGAGATNSIIGSEVSLVTIKDFNINDYPNADSIAFGVYLKSSNTNTNCIVELYDRTNDKIINNTLLSTNALDYEWNTTTVNFIEDLPDGSIDLGIWIKSETEGTRVYCFYPEIVIYR